MNQTSIKDEKKENQFSGVKINTPLTFVEISPEAEEIFNLAYRHSGYHSYNFTFINQLCAMLAEATRPCDLPLAMYAGLAYRAGQIEGIRQERARRKARG